jgi:hypothetical protein
MDALGENNNWHLGWHLGEKIAVSWQYLQHFGITGQGGEENI